MIKKGIIFFLFIITMFLNNKTTAKNAIVIDAGATTIRIGYWDGTSVRNVTRHDTPHYQTPECKGLSLQGCQDLWLTKLTQLVTEYKQHHPQATHVALAFPGPVDKNGNILGSANLWNATSCPIPRQRISAAFDLPVVIEVDVTMSLYRYVGEPSLQSINRIALLTISSGVAIKMYVRGYGVNCDAENRGGSICYLKVDRSTPPLPYPRVPGCVNACCSGNAMLALARRAALSQECASSTLTSLLFSQPDTITPAEFNHSFIEALKTENHFALKILTESTRYLADALTSYIIAAAPERIILMGGFAEAVGARYRIMLISALQEHCSQELYNYSPQDIETMIDFGIIDDMNGLIGAGIRVNMEQ